MPNASAIQQQINELQQQVTNLMLINRHKAGIKSSINQGVSTPTVSLSQSAAVAKALARRRKHLFKKQ